MSEGWRREVARSRRGTLVLSVEDHLTNQELDTLGRELKKAMSRVPSAIVLHSGLRFETVIPPVPVRRWRGSGYRPRWAR